MLVMARSVWKKSFLNLFFLNVYELKKKLYLVEEFGYSSKFNRFLVFVHNGKVFKKLRITRDKVGFKFGSFVNTRNRFLGKKHKK